MEKQDFSLFEFKKSALADLGLEEIRYPIPHRELPEIISSNDVPYHMLLLWLQLYSSVSPEDWEELERAMSALTSLIGGDARQSTANVAGDSWKFVASPADLKKEVVTIQRKQLLVAAISGSDQGGLIVSHYRPLDAKSIRYLLGLARLPYHDGTVSMRPNNFEYAKDCSAGMGNTYAFTRGEAHLSYWEFGVGLDREENPVDGWIDQRQLEPKSADSLAVEVGIFYQYADDTEL